METKTSRRKEKTSSSKSAKVTLDTPIIETHVPCEKKIREIAENLYHQRISRGESGTDLDDWFKAEEYLKDQDSF